MDNTIGMCVECTKDSDCGDAMSGKVCGDNGKCQDGCRGMGGNGCPTDKSCTSKDSTIGMCVTCTKDSDCGAASSGKVCDNTGMCIDGCRGLNGNGCPDGELCTSSDNSIGMCSGGNTGGGGSGTGGGSPSGFVASGNGLACAASPRSGENGSIWLLGSVVAALAALRRRRRD
jgi:MYXO-CTERM domain-containing protein